MTLSGSGAVKGTGCAPSGRVGLMERPGEGADLKNTGLGRDDIDGWLGRVSGLLS